MLFRSFSDVAYGHNPRRLQLTVERLQGIDFDLLPQVYRKLYPSAAGFRFTFVGNVDLATLKPLVEKYIGSLSADAAPIDFVDDKCDPVKGMVDDQFRTPMQQPKVSVRYLFSGEMPYTIADRVALGFLSEALNSRYLVSIREEKGGTYGVQVGQQTQRIPSERYLLHILFDTNEELADELCEIVIKEIEQIAAEGPRSEDVEKHREYLLKSWKNNLEQNGGWMNIIGLKHDAGLDYLADYEQAVRTLTDADVQAMARKVLADGNRVRIMMRPEAKAE